MNLEMSPVYKKIGPMYKGEAQKVIAALKEADPFQLKSQMDSNESGEAVLTSQDKTYPITKEMVEFKEIPPENLSLAEFSRGSVYVDATLTPELQTEGYAREIIRRIQDMRKELDLKVEDKIKASVDIENKTILDMVQSQRSYIAGEVRASELEMGTGQKIEGKLIKEWEVEELKISIGIDTI